MKRDSGLSASLDGLDEHSIPATVDKAIDALLNEDDKVTVSRTICTVIAFLQQWLIMYLCERLMQLITPETLIANHKKIPRHYINVYLNHQHHFNLKELIRDYQDAQLKRLETQHCIYNSNYSGTCLSGLWKKRTPAYSGQKAVVPNRFPFTYIDSTPVNYGHLCIP